MNITCKLYAIELKFMQRYYNKGYILCYVNIINSFPPTLPLSLSTDNLMIIFIIKLKNIKQKSMQIKLNFHGIFTNELNLK